MHCTQRTHAAQRHPHLQYGCGMKRVGVACMYTSLSRHLDVCGSARDPTVWCLAAACSSRRVCVCTGARGRNSYEQGVGNRVSTGVSTQTGVSASQHNSENIPAAAFALALLEELMASTAQPPDRAQARDLSRRPCTCRLRMPIGPLPCRWSKMPCIWGQPPRWSDEDYLKCSQS